MELGPNDTQPHFSPMYYSSLFKFLHANRIRIEVHMHADNPGVSGNPMATALFFTFLSRMITSLANPN